MLSREATLGALLQVSLEKQTNKLGNETSRNVPTLDIFRPQNYDNF